MYASKSPSYLCPLIILCLIPRGCFNLEIDNLERAAFHQMSGDRFGPVPLNF